MSERCLRDSSSERNFGVAILGDLVVSKMADFGCLKIVDFGYEKWPNLGSKNPRFYRSSKIAEILQNPEIGAKKMPKSALKSA